MTASLRAEAFTAMQTGRAWVVYKNIYPSDGKFKAWAFNTSTRDLATLVHFHESGIDEYQIHGNHELMDRYINEKIKELA